MAQRQKPARDTFLSPEWTIRHLTRKYPLTRLLIEEFTSGHCREMEELKLGDFLDRITVKSSAPSVSHDSFVAQLNNVVGAVYGAPVRGLRPGCTGMVRHLKDSGPNRR